MIVKEKYFPVRWLKILDITIEKGKGQILGKLRIIQLIEVDLQLLMRIFLLAEDEENIENDERISKVNYGSHENYSIESAILEKRIIFDNSLLITKPKICNLTDLQSYYNRQLANIGSIAEESIGRNRNAVTLFAKIILF